MTAKQPARRLGLAHFAFYRAYLEGSDAIDLGVLADRYLNIGRDPRRLRATLRWLQDELGAAARRLPDREAVRLLRLPRRWGEGTSDGAGESGVDSGGAHGTPPALETFRAEFDPDEVYNEAELVALYRAAHPAVPQERRAQRDARLHDKRLAALKRLELAVAQAPTSADPIDAWIEPAIATRLQAVGLTTLGQLTDTINVFGNRWYARVPRVGPEAAARVVQWLYANAGRLERPLAPRALTPLRQQSSHQLMAARDAVHQVAPSETLQLPHALSGVEGTNRAPRARNQTGADHDLAAIDAWLALHQPGSHTWRSYRTQAERILLWSVFERQKPLSSLDVSDITAYQAFLVDPPEKWIGARATPRWSSAWRPFAGKLSPASRATAFGVLKSLFQWLVDMRYLDFNPWTGTKPSAIERQSLGIKAHHALTRAQWEYVIGYVDQWANGPARERARFILMLGYATGLRLAEMASATVGALETTWVDDTLGTAWTVRVKGKGSKTRTVPLPRRMMDALRRYLRARDLPDDPLRADPNTPLIARLAGEEGRALGAPALALVFKKIFIGAAGYLMESDPHAARRLGAASTHWLRHTYGTRAIESGVPLDIVQENLGHASPATTSIYVTTELKRRIRAMEDFFDSGA